MCTDLIIGDLLIIGLPLALLIGIAREIYKSTSCLNYGPKHTWRATKFRVRICKDCGRKEVIKKYKWEFEGYEA